jgi:hypothetical protein
VIGLGASTGKIKGDKILDSIKDTVSGDSSNNSGSKDSGVQDSKDSSTNSSK